jgi:hypothetical protein
MKTVTCKTQMEIITAYLWSTAKWHATHELQGVQTPYGFIGSAGHARVRELARNDCPERLRDKVERKRGSEIGLNPKYEYFRYRTKPSRADYTARAAQMCRRFDAGLPAGQVFAA